MPFAPIRLSRRARRPSRTLGRGVALAATFLIIWPVVFFATAATALAADPATHFIVSYPATVTAGVPADVVVTAADGSRATDENYTGTVTLQTTDSQAELPASISLSAGIGTVSATLKTAGIQTITADDGSIHGTSDNIEVDPSGANHLTVVAGPSGSVGAGAPFAISLEVRDAFGNLVATDGTPVDVALSSGPNATLKGSTSESSSGGLVQFDNLSIQTAGDGYAINATSSGLGSGTTETFSVTPGPEAAVTPETAANGSGTVVAAQDVTAGSSVTAYAIARDTYGNFIDNVAATWSLANKTVGVVDGDLVPAGNDKSATFSGHKVGTAVIHVVDGSFSNDSGVLTVKVGPEATVTVEDQADGSGDQIAAQDVVAGSSVTGYAIARDSEGNFIDNVTADWSLTSVTDGVVSGDLVAAGDDKSATFTGHLVGSAAIVADDNQGTATASGTLTVIPGPEAAVTPETAANGSGTVVAAQDVTAGSSVTAYAIARDTYGNFIDNVAATWSLANKTVGVVDGDLVPAGNDKSATFSGHKVGTAVIHVVDGSFSNDSGVLTVKHGAPVKLAVTGQPGASYTADSNTISVTIEIQDAYGNSVIDGTGSGSNVTVAISPTSPPPSFGGTTTRTAIAGVATFADLHVRLVGTGYKLNATSSPSYTAASTNAFEITHGVATQLDVTANPGSSFDADATNISTVVTVKDAWGNTVIDGPGSGATVTLGISPASPSPNFGGTTTRSASAGIATFNDLHVRLVGTGYTLTATSSPYAPDTTTPFDITPGALHHFVWNATTQTAGTIPTQTAGVQVTIAPNTSPYVRAFDAWNNLKTNLSGSPSLTSTFGPSPNGQSATTSISWSGGVGTVAATTKAADLTGHQHFNVSLSGITAGGQSNDFIVNPNVAATTVFSDTGFNGQPIDTKISTPIYSVCVPSGGTAPCALAGATGSTGVRVLVRDAYGNPVLPTLITLGIDPSVNGLVGTSANVMTSNGIADFGDRPIAPSSATSGNINLRAHAPTGSDGISAGFQVALDLKACDGVLCTNNAVGTLQKGYNQITTTSDFFNGSNNVRLRTLLLGKSTFDAGNAGCGTNTLVNQGQEALPQGTGVQTTAPVTDMLIVISKDYLKQQNIQARSVLSFNVCVGATWIGSGPATPWLARTPVFGLPVPAKLNNGVYWGLAYDCFALPRNTPNPCIALRTKESFFVRSYFKWTAAQTAAVMKDGDLAFVIHKSSPWDGKAGIYR